MTATLDSAMDVSITAESLSEQACLGHQRASYLQHSALTSQEIESYYTLCHRQSFEVEDEEDMANSPCYSDIFNLSFKNR